MKLSSLVESLNDGTYYHKSPPSTRESILKHGLLPKVGDSYRCHYDGTEQEGNLTPAIFLCSNKDYDSTWDDDIWEISPAAAVRPDADVNCYDGCFITYEAINPNFLKLIYKGSGDSTF